MGEGRGGSGETQALACFFVRFALLITTREPNSLEALLLQVTKAGSEEMLPSYGHFW